jgi:hypothetical protein
MQRGSRYTTFMHVSYDKRQDDAAERLPKSWRQTCSNISPFIIGVGFTVPHGAREGGIMDFHVLEDDK